MGNIYIFYNKNNFKTMTIARPSDTVFDIEEFKENRIKYDNNYHNLSIDDIGCIIEDSVEYDTILEKNISHELFIDNNHNFKIKVRQIENMDNKYLVYGAQDIKRKYSTNDIIDMYHNDYLNFNLRNIAQSGVLKLDFAYLKDLNIKSTVGESRWESFFTDPYLKEMGQDKLLLGRDVVKNGIYFPFFIYDTLDENNRMTVSEGNHRAMSLKLLQYIGEIDDDYKVPCLYLPEKFKYFKDADFYEYTEHPVGTRYVMETKYTSNILNDKLIYDKALESINNHNGILHNEYTVEYYTKDVGDILFGPHSYALWLRDLIYPVRDIITPTKVLNDEELFYKWKAGEIDSCSSI